MGIFVSCILDQPLEKWPLFKTNCGKFRSESKKVCHYLVYVYTLTPTLLLHENISPKGIVQRNRRVRVLQMGRPWGKKYPFLPFFQLLFLKMCSTGHLWESTNKSVYGDS